MIGSADEFTELVDADVPRVDLVGKAANGSTRFLIMKGAADQRGLLEANMVRELLVKSDDITNKTNDELRRMALDGTAAQKAAALQEIGKRSLTGIQGPSTQPAQPGSTTAQVAPLGDAASAPPVAAGEMKPAPSGDVGTPSGAAAAVAKARQTAMQKIAKAKTNVVPGNPASEALFEIAKMQAAKVAADEIRRATSSQDALGSVPLMPESIIASPDVQARNVTPPEGWVDELGEVTKASAARTSAASGVVFGGIGRPNGSIASAVRGIGR